MCAASSGQLIILDADGVFMDEFTYWRTALATAFHFAGVRVADQSLWEEIDRVCLVEHRFHFVTKSRGCNSNWDLAAVLVAALEDESVGPTVRGAIKRGDAQEAGDALWRWLDRPWPAPNPGEPPVSAFGIDRTGDKFIAIRDTFQRVFRNQVDVGWLFPRHALAAPENATREALARLQSSGCTLTICTSRMGSEMEPPLHELDIARYFDTERLVTLDTVRAAQQELNRRPLGKPHWFPLAAAVIGFPRALTALRDDVKSIQNGEPIEAFYLGDSPADFDAARGCVERTLPITYIHVDSGVTHQKTLDEIEQHPMTRAVVPNIAEAIPFILEVKA